MTTPDLEALSSKVWDRVMRDGVWKRIWKYTDWPLPDGYSDPTREGHVRLGSGEHGTYSPSYRWRLYL